MYVNTPEKYIKVKNSGIFKLIADKKLSAQVLKKLNADSDLSSNIYKDLVSLNARKSIVSEFPATTNLQTVLKKTEVGDVIEVGNKMYLNDGKQLIEWNMSKEKYLELFPPVERFATVQGKLGDCYLIQALGLSMENPHARVNFLKSFQLKGNDIIVTIKGLENFKGSITFPNGEISLSKNGKHLIGCKGLQMYEQTYTRVALRTKGNENINPIIEPIDNITSRCEGGFAYNVFADIYGKGTKIDLIIMDPSVVGHNPYAAFTDNTIPYKVQNPFTSETKTRFTNYNALSESEKLNKFNSFFKDFPDKTLYFYKLDLNSTKILLERAANDKNFIISFGTIPKQKAARESTLLKQYNLVSSHAYSIIGYDVKTGIVKIVNPHSYSTITEIPIDVLQKYVRHLDFMKI